MDAANLAVGGALAIVAFVVGRGLFSSLGTASDCMASLFVPPDRALGWPHGVQERDDPWGWRAAPSASSAGPQQGADGDDDGAGRSGPIDPLAPRQGTFVVPVGRVAPVRLGVRPH
jgi:hypothetical protein